MFSSTRLRFTVIPFVAFFVLTPVSIVAGGKSVLRGWLSDEACSGGRAKSGLYTGTNPDCARKCVSEGKKIVFVDSDHKRLLSIANQEIAKDRVGDYVEINADFDEGTRTLRVDSVKLLEKGRAMCDVPTKKKT